MVVVPWVAKKRGGDGLVSVRTISGNGSRISTGKQKRVGFADSDLFSSSGGGIETEVMAPTVPV